MELWDLYDSEGRRTGKVVERGQRIPEGYCHLCVEIWIMNRNREVLLTQRNPDKWNYPLYWEATGGAVRAGENSREGALREAQEESGIHMKERNLFYIGSYREDFWSMDTYIYLIEETEYPRLNLQKEEVADARWVRIEDLCKEKKTIEGKIERFLGYSSKIMPIYEDFYGIRLG